MTMLIGGTVESLYRDGTRGDRTEFDTAEQARDYWTRLLKAIATDSGVKIEHLQPSVCSSYTIEKVRLIVLDDDGEWQHDQDMWLTTFTRA